jgi:hypothetical protein
MSDISNAPSNRNSQVENLAAEAASAAYAVVLRHRVEDKWLDLQLELWEALKETVKKWELEPAGFSGAVETGSIPASDRPSAFRIDWYRSSGPGKR